MKTTILAAVAALSLSVGSAYAQGVPAGFADGSDYQEPHYGAQRSLITPMRRGSSSSDPTRFSGRCSNITRIVTRLQQRLPQPRAANSNYLRPGPGTQSPAFLLSS